MTVALANGPYRPNIGTRSAQHRVNGGSRSVQEWAKALASRVAVR